MTARKRYSRNVPGDFYVEDGCCTMCGVAEAEAPELLASDPLRHSNDWQSCYFRRQPRSRKGPEHIINAKDVAEVDCIRYAGTDEKILKRLCEAGHERLCDLYDGKD